MTMNPRRLVEDCRYLLLLLDSPAQQLTFTVRDLLRPPPGTGTGVFLCVKTVITNYTKCII